MSVMHRLDKLKGMLQDSPNDSFLLFALAKEYEKVNELEKARMFYEKIIVNDPDYIGVYYHLGNLLALEGKPETALGIFSKGVEVASRLGDQHAKSELQNAKMNLELEL